MSRARACVVVRTTAGTWLAAILLASAALTSGPIAHAQVAEAYDREVDAALAAYDRGAFDEACAHFRAAHRALPGPRTLRGIGMCSFELRDHAEAYRALRAALAMQSSERPLSDAQRAHVEDLLVRVEPLVAVFTDVPARATLSVDGALVPVDEEGSIVLGLGPHDLLVTRDGRSVGARVHVRGGERGPLPLDRRALFAEASSPAPAPATTTAPSPPAPSSPTTATPSSLVTVLDLGVIPPPPPPPAPPDPRDFQVGGRVLASIGAWDGGAGAVGAWGSGLELDLEFALSDDVLLGPSVGIEGAWLLDGASKSESWWWLGTDVGLALLWHLPGTPVALRGAVAFSVAWRERLAGDGARTGAATPSAGASVVLGARLYLVPRVFYAALDARAVATELGAVVGTLGLGLEAPR